MTASQSNSTPSCPACGSTSVARIVYGHPGPDKALKDDVDAGRAVFGGCVVTGCDPKWACNDCNHRWGEPSFNRNVQEEADDDA